MNTPYLVIKELLPSGKYAWRRMVNPQYSSVPAIDVVYSLNLNLKPVYCPIQVVHHKPVMILGK